MEKHVEFREAFNRFVVITAIGGVLGFGSAVIGEGSDAREATRDREAVELVERSPDGWLDTEDGDRGEEVQRALALVQEQEGVRPYKAEDEAGVYVGVRIDKPALAVTSAGLKQAETSASKQFSEAVPRRTVIGSGVGALVASLSLALPWANRRRTVETTYTSHQENRGPI